LKTQSIVIGAGIVGLCTALYLQERGRRVTLIDRGGPGEGTSSGNAGIVSAGSCHPEAMPGIWRDIPEMVLHPMAPVVLRPGYLPRFLPWLRRFLAASSAPRAEAASIAIHALSSRAMDFLMPLVKRAGAAYLLRQDGLLYVHESAAQFERAKRNCAYYERRGVDVRLLGGEELREFEPALRPGIAGAVFIPAAGHTVSPLALSRALFQLFEQQGGEFKRDTVRGFVTKDGSISAVQASSELACDEVFVTAGAWSHRLAALLGSRVPLDTERGYHQQLPDPRITLGRSMLFPARGFAATSMQHGLRLAGTVEFAGLAAAPDYARARVLAEQALELFPGLNVAGGTSWMGYRPSLPDSNPVISASPRFSNVFFGFGHGHLGLTQSAVTGAMLAAMACGEESPVNPAPYRIDRRF
jgi:D-amino-acid dehydrogenase